MTLFFDFTKTAIAILPVFFAVIAGAILYGAAYFYFIRIFVCEFVGPAFGIKVPVRYVSKVNFSALKLRLAQLGLFFKDVDVKSTIIYLAGKVRDTWIYSLVTLALKKNVHVICVGGQRQEKQTGYQDAHDSLHSLGYRESIA